MASRNRFRPTAAAVLLLLVAGAPPPAAGQAIPRDAYLRYVPLSVPRLVEQTPASAAFHLFGDPADPGYSDVDPRDGIDDRRGRRLQELGARFGPVMVLNTTNLPMDFRRFMERSRAFNLHVDTWGLTGGSSVLLGSDTVDLQALVDTPCSGLPQGARDTAGDCLLLDLLRRYSPYEPDCAALAPRTEGTGERTFEVLFFDFPGEGPDSWKAEFENSFTKLLPRRYADYLKVYLHPFVHEVPAKGGEEAGYELVLQYYFFYPTNDGGNNHEGDWEHINVSVAPLHALQRPLTAAELQAILAGAPLGSPLVIRTIDYYMHENVYRMDYTRPDAYAPREEWERQRRAAVVEFHGEKNVWSMIRHRAWWDDAETILNTHPICYVGADNKGLDQLLSAPGGTNRDSHGTYPFTGLYKDIGPGGATEQIGAHLDLRRWYRERDGDLGGDGQERFGRGDAVPYTTAARIEVLPDWERVVAMVMEEPAARRDWFWMLLPVRWGYPATESPFAGVVAHASTGNLAPFGPPSQPHWNRVGTAGGAHAYQPHSFETMFPLGMQDTFVNSWGYLNLTLPVLASVPPLDFAWRLAAYPVRRVLQRKDPVFFPTESIPSRFVGLNAGFSSLHFNQETAALVVDGDPGLQQLLYLALAEPDGFVDAKPEVDAAEAWWWQVNLYLGDRFVTQNTLLNSRSRLGLRAVGKSGNEYNLATELNLWEVAGSFRYDLRAGTFRPYLKAGYGWTWYRTENGTFDGRPLVTADGAWINQPSFKSLGDMLPNSWHAGAGVEIISYRSGAPFPHGIDVSLVGEVTYTSTSLGIQDWLRVAGSADLGGQVIDTVPFRRWTGSLGLTLGF